MSITEKCELRIALSAIGRFHMFDLARQMLLLGQKTSVFTGNPRSRVDADIGPCVKTHPAVRVLSALRHKIPPTPNMVRWQDWDLEYCSRS